jgi:hypothetical protein
MNSPVTRDSYTTRLDRFFSFIGIEGVTVEERCRAFVEKAKKDNNDWAFMSIVSFLQVQKERVDRKEITGSTIRNYVKAIKLFTEMNYILIYWRRITRGLPKGRKWANDRAPTIEEIRKIVEYPDRRIKPIVSIDAKRTAVKCHFCMIYVTCVRKEDPFILIFGDFS